MAREGKPTFTIPIDTAIGRPAGKGEFVYGRDGKLGGRDHPVVSGVMFVHERTDEAGDPDVSQWRLVAENSTWSPADPRALRSLTIEQIELDPDTARLRCRLSDDSLLEIRPLARDSDDDPPSWKIETPFGMTLKHGPGLLVDDEALRMQPDA